VCTETFSHRYQAPGAHSSGAKEGSLGLGLVSRYSMTLQRGTLPRRIQKRLVQNLNHGDQGHSAEHTTTKTDGILGAAGVGGDAFLRVFQKCVTMCIQGVSAATLGPLRTTE
jgi:hypothetical protein